ncbi:MAG TPA: tetratricopeptide repeat protein [Brevundimonas sp.]|uniref:tetratricopeptide repeat protein n=1 Tax=Brevundimonas sp. TaxID=1871086 RepID=UPI002635AA43|nr:tetratricopeptide repeat protein [Brevundimonas sp.]HRO33999.1 tetratricopeptide repeat protein [Brevundimonas sp.]
MKPTIAVCVSGQLRQSDAGLESLAQAIRGLDATVVVSLWSRAGRKLDGAVNLPQISRILEEDAWVRLPWAWFDYREFWPMLPGLAETLSAGATDQAEAVQARVRRWLPDAVIDLEAPDVLDLGFDTPREDANTLKMLYRIWRANEIKRRLERQAGRRFDHVVRTRPDLVLERLNMAAIAEGTGPGRILVDAYRPAGHFVSDLFAVGGSVEMDRYATLFGRAIADPGAWRHIHVDMHAHLEASGLAYDAYPHVGGLTVDSLGTRVMAVAALKGEAAPSPAQAVALAALDAQGPDALDRLMAAPVEAVSPQVLDGWLFAAGEALIDAGQMAEGLSALLAGLALRPRDINWQGAAARLAARAVVQLAADDGVGALMSRVADSAPPSVVADAVARAWAWLDAEASPLDQATGQLARLAAAGLLQDGLARVMTPAKAVRLAKDIEAALGAALSADALMRLERRAETAVRAEADRAVIAELAPISAAGQLGPHRKFMLADAYKRLGRLEEAEREQTAALERVDHIGGGWRQLAEIQSGLGRFEAAVAAARRAYALEPDGPGHGLLLAYCLMRAGQAEEARALVAAMPDDWLAPAAALAAPDLVAVLGPLRPAAL